MENMKMETGRNEKNRRNPIRKNAGFTLIEVLVAMVILAVGLLGMASLSIAILKGNQFSKEVSSATTCAREKMEDLERMGYANTPTATGTVTESYGAMTQYPDYKRVTLTTVDAPATDMKTISVTVYWDSDSHQVRLRTFLAK